MPGGGAVPTSVGEAPRSGPRARRHLGAHRSDPAGTPPLAKARNGARTPRNARRSRGAWMPAARAGGSPGVGLEERSPPNPFSPELRNTRRLVGGSGEAT